MYKKTLWILFLLGTLSFLAGCSDSSPASQASSWLGVGAKDDSATIYRLTVQPGSEIIGVGQTMPLLIKLSTFGDVPVKEGNISLTSSNGGSFDGDDQTNAKGFAQKTFTAGALAGTTLITASAFDAIATLSVQVQPVAAGVARVTVFVAAEVLKPSQSMPIQVYVADAGGVPIDKARVNMLAANGGGFFDINGNIDDSGDTEEGWYTTTFIASSSVGQETITALSLGQTDSKTISVRE